jgi:hypothetical protein
MPSKPTRSGGVNLTVRKRRDRSRLTFRADPETLRAIKSLQKLSKTRSRSKVIRAAILQTFRLSKTGASALIGGHVAGPTSWPEIGKGEE